MSQPRAIESGRRVLLQESEALSVCAAALGDSFVQAVEWMRACQGRIVCCGIGKSGHIANKTAATLASTGTPAFFLHAAEAVHGDLGMVTENDVVLLYTHSGETDELVRLFPSFKRVGSKTILITGRPGSTAARLSDLVLDTGVRFEACSNNLAPTTSTTVMVALSDALAVAIMDQRGFGKEDFAKFHPAGALGKRLLLLVRDVMRPLPEIATVDLETPLLEVMHRIADAAVGAAVVTDPDHRLLGIVTEGDIRRHLLKAPPTLDVFAGSVMTSQPATVPADLLAFDALEVFQNYPAKIGEMPVIENDRVAGLLMLKDLLRAGLV